MIYLYWSRLFKPILLNHCNFVFRTPNESEPLPSELKDPIAIADDLLHPTPTIEDSAVVAVGLQSGVLEESKKIPEAGEETLGKVCFYISGDFLFDGLILSFLNSAQGRDAGA